MVAGFDLDSLSDETREELAQLAAQEDTPGSDADAEQKKDDQVPAYVQTILDQSKAERDQLLREFRTLQGTFDRYRADVASKARPAETPAPDDLEDVDDSDPSIAKLKTKIKALEKTLSQVEGVQTRTVLSAQEQQQRDGWMTWLREGWATDLGVDFGPIEAQLKGTPTGELAEAGRKLITEAAKGKGKGSEDTATLIAKAVAQAKKELLQQFGVWDDVVSGAGAGSTDDAKFLEDYAAGRSDDHKRAEKLLKNLR